MFLGIYFICFAIGSHKMREKISMKFDLDRPIHACCTYIPMLLQNALSGSRSMIRTRHNIR